LDEKTDSALAVGLLKRMGGFGGYDLGHVAGHRGFQSPAQGVFHLYRHEWGKNVPMG